MDENQKQNQEMSPYMVPASIIVAGLFIAGAVFYSNSEPRNQVNVPQVPSGAANVAGVAAVQGDLSDDDPVLGNPDAPVTVVEFSDFQCPFCRRLFSDTLPQLKEKYVKTGKVKFVYRDFPLAFHPMAQKYAEAGECADEQGKFWQMHDKIFEEQGKQGTGTISGITVDDVKKWAKDLGLDGAGFNNCLDSGKYSEEISKDTSDGQKAGVSGTPATFVNGRLISGAVPFAQFEAAIEEELKKAR